MITRRDIEANAIRLRVAEAGEGPLVLLCHGWPETSFSWRHQMTALAAAGFRAVAPDMRGYGRSDAPPRIEDYTIFHLVGDMVGLLDALGAAEAAIVGHDWGAAVAWNAALMRPDRFRAVVAMSVPYTPRGPRSVVTAMREAGLHGFYMMYFQEPGVAEAELERDVEDSLRRLYYAISGDVPQGGEWRALVQPGGGLLDAAPAPSGPISWLPEKELAEFVAAFRRSGFRGGLNWYRNLHRNWELLAPFDGAKIPQDALFIAGSRDPVLKMPGMRGRAEKLAGVVPKLRRAVLLDGAGHWVQQERPEEVNAALLDFLRG